VSDLRHGTSLTDDQLLREVDDSLLAQWRKSGLEYAADVVAALLRRVAAAELRAE
jgi:hypothetical protein